MSVSNIRKTVGLFIGALVLTATSFSQGRIASSTARAIKPPQPLTSMEQAFGFLGEMLDRYHDRFYVYSDKGAGGNHWVPCGWMGDIEDLDFNAGWTAEPLTGTTCLRIQYTPTGSHDANWAGIYWLSTENNWGDALGYRMTGATTLTFWARGERGGEHMEFKVGGVNRHPHCQPQKPYQDSFGPVTTGVIKLSQSWKQYSIDLTGYNLSNCIGGFCIATNVHQNHRGCVIYLDDIAFDLARPEEPRFATSFVAGTADFDKYLRNVAFLYDNALALLAFLARGTQSDMRHARMIAEAIVCAQRHDRYFTDGRLRNAYRSGDLADYLTGEALLPGWWDPDSSQWYEDCFQVSTHTGNLAWAIIALMRFYETDEDPKYLKASEEMAAWIVQNCYSDERYGGYLGGYEGWRPSSPSGSPGQVKLRWKSTEHNIDVYAALMALYRHTRNEKWKRYALHGRRFVEAMWDDGMGLFWTGTAIREADSAEIINKDKLPLDVNPWAVMALGNLERYGRALKSAHGMFFVDICPSGCGFSGYDFDSTKDGVWFEGTAQMCVAFQIDSQEARAERLLAELRSAQQGAEGTDRKGLVAACHNGVSTSFGWDYNARLHIGATAWMLFAELRFNPYWGIRTDANIPFQDIQ